MFSLEELNELHLVSRTLFPLDVARYYAMAIEQHYAEDDEPDQLTIKAWYVSSLESLLSHYYKYGWLSAICTLRNGTVKECTWWIKTWDTLLLLIANQQPITDVSFFSPKELEICVLRMWPNILARHQENRNEV